MLIVVLIQELILLDQPDEIVLSEIINMHQNVSCYDYADGQVQLSVNGGQPTYSFTQVPGLTQSSSLFEGLSAGNYAYVVADANNCTDSIILNISEPPPIILAEDLNQHYNIICYNVMMVNFPFLLQAALLPIFIH